MNSTDIAHSLSERMSRDKKARHLRVIWSKRLRRFCVQRPNTPEADEADKEAWRLIGVYRKSSPTLVDDLAEDVEYFMKNTLRTTG